MRAMQVVQQMQQQQAGEGSQSGSGDVIDWFPTETIRPTESLGDGGIIIIGEIPTESIHLFEVLI